MLPPISSQFASAVEYARTAHAAQVRKGTSIPYISHPLAVSSLVLEFGGSEEQAIAALLHDVLEDCGQFHERSIRAQFGDEVADIVVACTDGTAETKGRALSPEEKYQDWQERKHAYLKKLIDEPDNVLLVSACDKLHNAQAILTDLRDPTIGITVFDRFTGGIEGTLRYYQSLLAIIQERGCRVGWRLSEAIEAIHRGVDSQFAVATNPADQSATSRAD